MKNIIATILLAVVISVSGCITAEVWGNNPSRMAYESTIEDKCVVFHAYSTSANYPVNTELRIDHLEQKIPGDICHNIGGEWTTVEWRDETWLGCVPVNNEYPNAAYSGTGSYSCNVAAVPERGSSQSEDLTLEDVRVEWDVDPYNFRGGTQAILTARYPTILNCDVQSQMVDMTLRICPTEDTVEDPEDEIPGEPEEVRQVDAAPRTIFHVAANIISGLINSIMGIFAWMK